MVLFIHIHLPERVSTCDLKGKKTMGGDRLALLDKSSTVFLFQ